MRRRGKQEPPGSRNGGGRFLRVRRNGLTQRFYERRLIFLHRFDVGVLGGAVGLAGDDGVEGVDLRAGLPGDGLGGYSDRKSVV